MNFSRTLSMAVVTVSLVAISGYALAKDEGKAPQNFSEQQTSFEGKPRGFDDDLKFTSVTEVLKNSHDHDKVVVKGKLTKFIGGEKYQLTDENNDNIVVKLDDDKDWSYLAKDMPIVVFAEVDNDHMTKVLEVKKARPDRGRMVGPQGGPHVGPGPHGMHGPRGEPNGSCPVCPVCETKKD